MAKPGYKVVYVELSTEELRRLQAIAALERVHLCQWIRECINDRLLEIDDNMPLLKIRTTGRPVVPTSARQRAKTA